MDDETKELQAEFYQESRDHLENLSDTIIKAEADPENVEHLSSIFRSIHTIKGCAGFLEFPEIQKFSHSFENVLSELRDGNLKLNEELVDVILASGDHLSLMLDDQESDKGAKVDQELMDKFKAFCDRAGEGKASDSSSKETSQKIEISDTEETESIDEESLKEFLLDSNEMLQKLDRSVVEYEKTNSPETINEVFRIIHTIKGDSDLIGLRNLCKFSHALESLLSRLRSKTLKPTPDIIDTILKSTDAIADMIKKLQRGESSTIFPDVFYSQLQKYKHGDGKDGSEVGGSTVTDETGRVFVQQVLQFKDVLSQSIGQLPIDEASLKTVKRILDSLKRSAKFVGIKTIDIVIGNALDSINNKEEDSLVNAIGEIIAFIAGIEGSPKKIGEILVEDGKLSESDINEAVAEQKQLGEILVEKGKVAEKDLQQALKKQDMMEVATQLKPEAANAEARTIRVDENKIENFTSIIGELLIAKNTYDYLLDKMNIENGGGDIAERIKDLRSNAHLFTRLTNDMQFGIISLRMIPVKGIFQKFNRVIREISRKQKKSIELVLEGEDTEIDKKIADILSEPMVHMVRNSCDHGIEEPDVRKAAGKPEKGTVVLSAAKEGSNLLIKIKDDGKGLSRKVIYEKALSKGIDVSSPDDESLFNVIFLPGFSTKDVISDVSGRGVGMDVVKSTLDSLGGEAQVTSEEGKGSEITLTIPMSLGITSSLLVEYEKKIYALPIESILESIKVPTEKVKCIHDRMIIHYRGEVLPVEILGNLLQGLGTENQINFLDASQQKTKETSLIILKSGNKKAGIIVDNFVRNIDIAIKPVPECLSMIDVVSGVSIMGDGKIILVLNPAKLIQ